MSERTTTMSLTRADVATLRTAVSYLSESEGNGPDLDALLDKLYQRLDQAVARLDRVDPIDALFQRAHVLGSTFK